MSTPPIDIPWPKEHHQPFLVEVYQDGNKDPLFSEIRPNHSEAVWAGEEFARMKGLGNSEYTIRTKPARYRAQKEIIPRILTQKRF